MCIDLSDVIAYLKQIHKTNKATHQHYCVDCDGLYSCRIKKTKQNCALENSERCLEHYLEFSERYEQGRGA